MAGDHARRPDGLEAYMADGWDGDGCRGISPATLAAARRVLGALPPGLPPADPVPDRGGGIGLEWKTAAVWVDVGPGARIATLRHAFGGAPEEGRRDADDPALPGVLARLFRGLAD